MRFIFVLLLLSTHQERTAFVVSWVDFVFVYLCWFMQRFIFSQIFHSTFLCSTEQRGHTFKVAPSSCLRYSIFRCTNLRLLCALLCSRHTLVLSALVFKTDVTVLHEIQNCTAYSWGNFRKMILFSANENFQMCPVNFLQNVTFKTQVSGIFKLVERRMSLFLPPHLSQRIATADLSSTAQRDLIRTPKLSLPLHIYWRTQLYALLLPFWSNMTARKCNRCAVWNSVWTVDSRWSEVWLPAGQPASFAFSLSKDQTASGAHPTS